MLIWNKAKCSVAEYWLDLLSLVRFSSMSKTEISLLGVAIIIGSIVRGYFLTHPIQYDEAYTYFNFVSQGIHLFNYHVPNNHVFYTILVKSSVEIFGVHPASMRLPAFLAGLITIPIIFFVCRSLNKGSGLLASMMMAVFPLMIFYSDVARGYSLIVFFSLALVLCMLLFVKKPSKTGCLFSSLIASLGLFTIPTMLFPIAGIYIWTGLLLLIRKRSLGTILTRFILPCGITTFVLTIFFYTPTILISGGIAPLISNRFVVSQPWGEFFHDLSPHIHDILFGFSRDIPIYALLGALIFLIIGIVAAIKKHDWASLLLLPSLLLGSVLILVLNHRIPFVRTWIYLIPFILISIDTGFSYVNGKLSYKNQSIVFSLITLLVADFTFSLMSRNVIPTYDDAGALPSAPIVAKYLRPLIDADDIIHHAEAPYNWPISFYLWYYNTDRENKVDSDGIQNEFFIVVNDKKKLNSEKKVTKVLDFENVTVYRTLLSEE